MEICNLNTKLTHFCIKPFKLKISCLTEFNLSKEKEKEEKQYRKIEIAQN